MLICVMATRATVLRPDTEDRIDSLPIYLMPLIEDPAPIRKSKAPAPTIKAQPSSTESTAIAIAEPQQVPDTEDTPAPQVDWAKEAATAIQKMSQSKPEPGKFGDPPQEESSSESEPLGVFAKQRQPRRRAGLIEEPGPGIERRWISEKCYREFGQPPELFAAQGPRVNPVHCMLGPSSVDGDLFDHLKPKYLK